MKKITALFTAVLASAVFALTLFAKDISAENSLGASEFSSSVQMAMSNTDYMVTAGDIYSLTYSANGIPVSYTIPVDPTYKIRVSNLAVLDASGKSFITLKQQVEEIVQKNYPMSGVQFVLLNPASFKVVVKGEVIAAVAKQAWALTRLSSVISGTATNYTSVRDVVVTSKNGKKHTYDLFKATRFGDLSQDPYVRPGDVITLNKIRRKVTVTGEIERPGTYELMKGENIKELVEYYGGGLTELADTSRMELVRNRDNMDAGGEKLYLNQVALDNNFEMLNGDSVYIAGKGSLLPSIIVEGIINLSDEITADKIDGQNQEVHNMMRRRAVMFYEGENYATFIRRYREIFNSYSDLVNSYVERNGKKISMNLEEMIYDELYMSSYFVQKNDKLVVPFQQHFVNVLINGEVNVVREESAWPLRRLSAVLDGNLTGYSSTRNVMVTSVDGIITYYDLFKASRDGDLEQDPYIRAGETVTVQRIDRRVSISGAVERPGVYELLPGENIRDLIEYYGHGITETADTSRIELLRILNGKADAGEKIYLDQKSIDDDYELKNYDSISIGTFVTLKPVMFVEGAISVSEGTALEAATRIPVQFESKTNYAFLVREHSSWFTSAASDTKNAFIIRGDQIIPVDIDKMLYDQSYYSELTVEADDILRVPFKQYFVSVAGAVYAPGRYPYIPDRTYDYYVGLAGGFIKEKNSHNAVQIVDIEGRKLSKTSIITPETTITAESNSGFYRFSQWSSVILTILSLISTSLSTVALIIAFGK